MSRLDDLRTDLNNLSRENGREINRLNERLLNIELGILRLRDEVVQPEVLAVASGDDLAHLAKLLKVVNERPDNQLLAVDFEVAEGVWFTLSDTSGLYGIRVA